MILARGAALLFACSLLACRGPASAVETRAALGSRAVTPSELFPEDLDLVVRIDAARIRQNPMLAGVVRELGKSSASKLVASAKDALADANAVWVGTRFMSDGFHGDGIVAIEALSARDPRTPEVQVFERPASTRSDPALEVILQSRGVVLATAAEADGVLRVLRAGPDPGRLDPPARGLVSFAGRIRGGMGWQGKLTSGAFREVTDGLIGYAGTLEERDNVEVEASLTYASADRAAAAAGAANRLAKRLAASGGLAKTIADSMKLTETGSSLQVRARVPFAWLAELH